MIDPARFDPQLAAAFRSAAPFPHLTVDDLLSDADFAAVRAAAADEPKLRDHGEIFDFFASPAAPTHPTLARFADALRASAPAVAAIAGTALATVELRTYLYPPGGYLLPHSDCRSELGRKLAFSFYLSTEPCEGGDLELFACDTDDSGAIVATRAVKRVAYRPNRLVLFAVTPTSLHQVLEVRAGARASLAGWFH